MRRRLLRLLPLSALLGVGLLMMWTYVHSLSEVPASVGENIYYDWLFWRAPSLMNRAIWLYVLRAGCDHWLQWVSVVFLILLPLDFALGKLRQARPRLFSILLKYSRISGSALILCSLIVPVCVMCFCPSVDYDWTFCGIYWLGSLPVSVALTLVIMGAVIIYDVLGYLCLRRSDQLKCAAQKISGLTRMIITSVHSMSPWRRAIVAGLLIALAYGAAASIGCERQVSLAEQHGCADWIGDHARGRTASEIIDRFGRPQLTETEKASFDGSLPYEHVYPWQKLPADRIDWIYMTGSNTCEKLTMSNNRCTAAYRAHCFYQE